MDALDDATVVDAYDETSVVDSPYEASVHPETLEETPPLFLVTFWDSVTSLTITYGWYILAVALAVIYYWERIQLSLEERYKKKSEKEYEAKCKKNPDLMRKRQEEMEAARKRMQEEMDHKAVLHAAKIKEKEEQRRAELLAAHPEAGQKLGNKESSPTSASQTTRTNTSKNNFRPEYNPLMGSGSSGGYRPARRGCPGGGCG